AIENGKGPRKSSGEIFGQMLSTPSVNPLKFPVGGGTYGYPNVLGGNGNILGMIQQEGFRENFNSLLSGQLNLKEKLDFITKGLSIGAEYSFDGRYFYSLDRSHQTIFARYTNPE